MTAQRLFIGGDYDGMMMTAEAGATEINTPPVRGQGVERARYLHKRCFHGVIEHEIYVLDGLSEECALTLFNRAIWIEEAKRIAVKRYEFMPRQVQTFNWKRFHEKHESRTPSEAFMAALAGEESA